MMRRHTCWLFAQARRGTTTINTSTAIITTSKVDRLLGAQVHQDIMWKEHILENDDSLLKSLNKRAGALKKISRTASFKTRKMVAIQWYLYVQAHLPHVSLDGLRGLLGQCSADSPEQGCQAGD